MRVFNGLERVHSLHAGLCCIVSQYHHLSRAFQNCTSLVKVVLHEGLIRIGHGAFAGCSSLHHIDIPHSVTAIWEGAFHGVQFYSGGIIFGGLESVKSHVRSFAPTGRPKEKKK